MRIFALLLAAATSVSGYVAATSVSGYVAATGQRAAPSWCPRSRVPCAMASGYTVRLPKPLGIRFEEVEIGKPAGVAVAELIEGGNADIDGRILVGDKLTRVSAVQLGGQSALLTLGTGTQYTSMSREMIPVSTLDFDTIMAAIGSNEGRWGYTDVQLELVHTDESVPRPVRPLGERTAAGSSPVEWDGARGTVVNGRSVPLRPGRDNF